MSTSRPLGSIRLAFRLGPWRSPRVRGWQTAYDGIVERLTAAHLPIYGVLEADLAAGEAASARWYSQYIAHVAAVIERYSERIPTFEILPGPNRRDTTGKPLLSPAAFARTLALVYEQVKADGQARQTVLVAGAVALAEDGAQYLAQTLTFGAGSTAWEAVRQATRAGAPFDAIAVWPSLPDTGSPIPPDHLPTQVRDLASTLDAFAAVVEKRLYLSGFTWSGQGAAFSATEIEAALVGLARQEPHLRYAARETTLAGPAVLTPDASLVDGFAIVTPGGEVMASDALPRPPVVDGFDFPVGPREAPEPPDGYYSAVGLADEDYYRTFRAWHTGDDWNGPGPGDADLGLPVYAIAHGVVTAAGYYTPSWGNIVLLQHSLPNGSPLWSQYAHLHERRVQAGQTVERGQIIGAIGKGANGMWAAHLHFEVRSCDLPPNNWQPFVSDRQRVLTCYFPTIPFTRRHRPGQFEAEGIILDSEPTEQLFGVFVKSDTPHWYPSFYGWNGTALYTYGSLTETEWGEWRPRLEAAGHYEVQVYVPGVHATTRNARYLISHSEGERCVAVDQSRYHDEWVTLGAYPFAAEGGFIRLSDQTGEPDSARYEVAFDAIRWLRAT